MARLYHLVHVSSRNSEAFQTCWIPAAIDSASGLVFKISFCYTCMCINIYTLDTIVYTKEIKTLRLYSIAPSYFSVSPFSLSTFSDFIVILRFFLSCTHSPFFSASYPHASGSPLPRKNWESIRQRASGGRGNFCNFTWCFSPPLSLSLTYSLLHVHTHTLKYTHLVGRPFEGNERESGVLELLEFRGFRIFMWQQL